MRLSNSAEKKPNRGMSELRSANMVAVLLAMLVLLFAYGVFP